ncbi:MAG: MBL fold metallo-hydrolase [Kiritimatiellia bacterium]
MDYQVMPVGPIEANCVVLWGARQEAWIVDPGADAAKIVSFLEERKLTPVLVALTHGHFDHIGAVTDLVARWPQLPVHLGPADEPLAFNPLNAWAPYYAATARPPTLAADLTDGAELAAGGLAARVIATPGHTPGGVCLHFESDGLLLTGDTLFAGSCGRTDFPGGSAPVLKDSLKRLAAFPPETRVVAGHGEMTTIAQERATNPFLR